MKIIKKDGRLQDFEINKISHSISSASDDIGQPLNEADVNNISENVETTIKKIRTDNTSSYEVFAVVLDILRKEGFNPLANAYFKGKDK